MQNFFSNIVPGGDASQPENEVPKGMKYLTKAAGVVAGIVAMIFGLWACISFSPICILSGVCQIIAGFIVVVIEAPYCCMFLDFVQQFSSLVENRPVWQKAALYLCLSVLPLVFCRGFTILVGSMAIFIVFVLNGVIVMGKKGSREDMMAANSGTAGSGNDFKDNLKSGLVGNIRGQDVEAAAVAASSSIRT